MRNDGDIITKITTHDEFGRFTSFSTAAGKAMLEEMAEEGAKLSRELAPRSGKNDPRSKSVADSMESHVSGDTASWTSTARHAMAVELGSVRHFQSGWVNFFWEKAGRDWEPGPNLIDHPPTAPKPYLRPAWEIIMSRWPEFARRHFGR